jgi:hypothetical protein
LSHNPHYDETFFISQFLKGLKPEIRVPVASQISDTLDRAILLAHVQQDLQMKKKPWVNRQSAALKMDQAAPRQDHARPALKLGNGDLWRDR